MSYYDDFLQARNVVLSKYPDATCKYVWGSFKVFENNETESFMEIVGSSQMNEPCAWLAAAEYIEYEFLWTLEQ